MHILTGDELRTARQQRGLTQAELADRAGMSQPLIARWGPTTSILTEGDVYHSPTVFQLKAMLYHVGLLTERGSEPNKLDPEADAWRLRHPVVETDSL